VKELIEFIAKKLVDHPDDVQVAVSDSEDGQLLELRVNPEDMGKIIGKSGRTAKAIRTVVSSAAAKADAHVNLQIVE
jgi:predicted RNA-binding protein YlqC (UPF0109 family)